jgi:hypothetical protein
MRKFLSGVLLLCLPVSAAQAASIPLPRAKPSVSGKLFDRLGPEATGLDAVNRIVPDHANAHLYATGMGGGSLAVGDVDRDGRLDIFVAGGAGPNVLYRQTGPMKFTDITAGAGPLLDGGTSWATGCAMVDIDADGDLDIFVCNYESPCQLFINTGRGPDGSPVFFREAAGVSQLNITDACAVPFFCDYDRDGDLDLYIVTGRVEDPAGYPEKLAVEMTDGVPALKKEAQRYYEPVTANGGKTWTPVPAGRPDYLLRNEGLTPEGTVYFRDISQAAGITARGEGEGAVWWDADGDGWMDLYVSNAGHAADVLYHNQRNGGFLTATPEQLSVLPWHGSAAAVGDFNGDALPDLFAGGMGYPRRADRCLTELLSNDTERAQALFSSPPQEERSALFLNSGAARFAECAWLGGVARTGAVRGAQWLDADHDGRQDLFLLHGQARRFGDPAISAPGVKTGKRLWDLYAKGELQKEPLMAMRNTGGLKLEDVSDEWGLGQSFAGSALAAADFDSDGDLDLLVLAYDEAPVIYRNGVVKQNVLTIRLLGPPANPYAIGTILTAKGDKGSRWQQIMPCNGGRGQGDTVVHFSLGSDPVIQELLIRWPTGAEQRVTSLIGGNAYALNYPARPQPAPEAAPRETFFTKVPALERIRHTDMSSREFTAQTLLPFTNATAGPALAWTDADGDGDYDLFTGGGAGGAGRLRLNDGQGRMVLEWCQPLEDDAASGVVDAGAVWFDADADGDVDLFVAGGSTSHKGSSPVQRDRLYLNDGKGQLFSCSADVLPQDGQASSIVCVADYDHDGDFDIFTGARALPGDYGSVPGCQLLRNDSTGGIVQFTSAAAEMDLRVSGMVTSAVWTDLDNDTWPDLVIACDWGPVRIFLNRVGKRLEEVTSKSGMEKMSGWWQSVVSADVNGDGSMDLIVGNAGANSAHRAPVTAFSVRPEGVATPVFLMTEKFGNALYPERSPAAIAAAIPPLNAKYPRYADLAAATAADVAGKEGLDSAVKLEAAVLESGVFINTPAGERQPPKFVFHPLPMEAQLAPVFGIAVTDFDGDGDQDLVLAQNSRNSPPGEGARDGGLCAFLLNDGKGNFSTMSPAQSGLVFSGEYRACTVADLNFDGRPDVVMSAWRDGLAGFINTGPRTAPILRVNLPPALAPGVRVTVERTGVPNQTAEYAAGGGWLSQSAPALFFGLGSGPRKGVVTVRWPDDRSWVQSFDETKLTLTAPAK